jgi:hypothetical protein
MTVPDLYIVCLHCPGVYCRTWTEPLWSCWKRIPGWSSLPPPSFWTCRTSTIEPQPPALSCPLSPGSARAQSWNAWIVHVCCQGREMRISHRQPLRSRQLSSSAHLCIKAVVQIHDILVWIRIRGPMPLTNGSGFDPGSGFCYFRHWPSRSQQKTIF